MYKTRQNYLSILIKIYLSIVFLSMTLFSSEVDFEDYFDKNTAIMFLIDSKNGYIIKANQSAANFYGYSIKQLQRMKIQDINILSSKQIKLEMRAATDEKRNYFIFRHRLSDKSIKRVEVYSHPMTYKKIDVLLSIVHDVSNLELAKETIKNYSENLEREVDSRIEELKANRKGFTNLFIVGFSIQFLVIFILLYIINQKKKLESKLTTEKNRARKAEKAKSEFLANMSHEIRTPLNGILGFVDILKDNLKNKQNKEYLKIIDSSGNHLLGVIEDILDFSKIESKKLEIEQIDFDVKDELLSVVELFKAKASEKNIVMSVNLDNDLPQTLNADPLRIKQVISNLLSNAIKFTDNGKKIHITLSYEDETLSVCVKDEGIGIKQKKLKHIFEAFGQEDSSTTREFGGTGLGLSISKELIKLMNGELNVESEVGKGSEFYFSVPAKQVNSIVKHIEKTEFRELIGRVLIVEDNKANQMFLSVILKKMKLDFEIANDGLEAVEMCTSTKYDAVFMDENMPNMNGIQATKHIREYEKKNVLEHTPVIALTANALKGDREKFLKAGMDEYITKPFNKKKIYEVLNRFL